MDQNHDEEKRSIELPIAIPGKSRGHRGRRQSLVDPKAALPGSIKNVSPGGITAGEKGSQQELRIKHKRYIWLLANPREGNHVGDPVPALAEVFGLTVEQAELRQVQLHDSLVKSVRNVTLTDALRDSDLGIAARVELLRQHALNVREPMQSLRALDQIQRMDEDASGGAEDSFEDYLAQLVGKQ